MTTPITASPATFIPLPAPTLVQLAQGSPEWLTYRNSRRNASESAAVLGICPWTTPYQLWMLKTGKAQPRSNVAMRHGSELEHAARAAYEAQTGQIMQPMVLQAGDYSASLDGMTLGGDLILEVKCPFHGVASELWRSLIAGVVPEHYVIQIQHQLMVSGAATTHLWVYDGNQGLLKVIGRDEAIMARIQAAWDGFQAFLDNDQSPPLMDSDTAVRTDEAWAEAAEAFRQAKQVADAAVEGLDQARQAVLSLASHPKESGAGVTVTRYWKQGNVDYKKVPALQGLDLSPWRAKGREEVRVLVS